MYGRKREEVAGTLDNRKFLKLFFTTHSWRNKRRKNWNWCDV